MAKACEIINRSFRSQSEYLLVFSPEDITLQTISNHLFTFQMLPFIKTELDDYDSDYDFLEIEKKTKRNTEARLKRANETEEQTMMRRELNKLRQRTRRASETDEQRDKRRERAKLQARWKRAQESDEQRSLRRETAKERKRIERAMETEEQTAKRRELARHRTRLIRAMESEEEKERRRLRARERGKLKRALEIEEEKVRRREVAKERARKMRANQTEEQRQQMKERGRERMKKKRALELLKSYGYTDHKLEFFGHYLETAGDELGSDFDCIKKFFLGKQKRKSCEAATESHFAENVEEHNLNDLLETSTDPLLDQVDVFFDLTFSKFF